MANPELKEAVWKVLDDFARMPESGGHLHSDLVVRKFPKVNELELINVIGELVEDGRVTVKAATVDAQGQPTAYHIHVRGVGDRPDAPPPTGGVSSSSVGFASEPNVSSATPAPPEDKQCGGDEPSKRAGRIDVGFSANTKTSASSSDSESPRPIVVGANDATVAAHQEEAEQAFADEAASFFAELLAVDSADEEAKKELTDQMTVLLALFQSDDAANFTTPINKLAGLKARVQKVAPELVPDFLLLMQAGLRAWLDRM